MERFGSILKKVRRERGLTLEILAAKLGTYKGYISGIENGKVPPPSMRFLPAMARVLGLDVRELAFLSWAEKTPRPVRKEALGFFQKWREAGKPSPDRGVLKEKPDFGSIFRAARHGLNLTMDEVARKAGIHKGYVSGIETGRFRPPSIRALKPLVRVLGLEADLHPLALLGASEKGPRVVRKELAAAFLGGYADWAKKVPQEPATRLRWRPRDLESDGTNRFGDRIRAARGRLDMPQTDLGRKLGVSQGLVSAIERGSVPPPKDKGRLKVLSRVLKEDFDALVELAKEERKPAKVN